MPSFRSSPESNRDLATTAALKLHGGVDAKEITKPNMDALKSGAPNLQRHIQNMKGFGQSVVVSFNRFKHDTDEEVSFLEEFCASEGVVFAINNGFVRGGEGASDLARKVVDLIENNPSKDITFTYDLTDSIKTKIEKIATKIYRAGNVTFTGSAATKMKQFEAQGWGDLPICIAKTQYSFSDDEKKICAPTGFTINVRDLVINAGAGFIVAVAGEIMRMPGLPKDPQAMHIKLVNGEIEGLS